MSYVKIILLVLQFVQYMVERAKERRLISQGEQNEVLASLETIRGMVSDANKIEGSVADMSDDDVTRELQSEYGVSPGPGQPGNLGGQQAGRELLPNQQIHPSGR